MDLLIKKIGFSAIILLSCATLITACGKKPADIKAPPHVTKDAYPQSYPAKAPMPNQKF